MAVVAQGLKHQNSLPLTMASGRRKREVVLKSMALILRGYDDNQ